MKISPISHSFEMELAAEPWRYPSRASLIADVLLCSGMRYAWFKGNLVPFKDAPHQDAPSFADPDDVLAGGADEAARLNRLVAAAVDAVDSPSLDGAFSPLDFRFDLASPAFRLGPTVRTGHWAAAIAIFAGLHREGSKFGKTAEVARISPIFRSLLACSEINGRLDELLAAVSRLVAHGFFARLPAFDAARSVRTDDRLVLMEEA